jgi:cell division protein FtsB
LIAISRYATALELLKKGTELLESGERMLEPRARAELQVIPVV